MKKLILISLLTSISPIALAETVKIYCPPDSYNGHQGAMTIHYGEMVQNKASNGKTIDWRVWIQKGNSLEVHRSDPQPSMGGEGMPGMGRQMVCGGGWNRTGKYNLYHFSAPVPSYCKKIISFGDGEYGQPWFICQTK